jgi:hypothetical protein
MMTNPTSGPRPTYEECIEDDALLMRMLEEIALDVGVTLHLELLDDGSISMKLDDCLMEQIHEFDMRLLELVDQFNRRIH